MEWINDNWLMFLIIGVVSYILGFMIQLCNMMFLMKEKMILLTIGIIGVGICALIGSLGWIVFILSVILNIIEYSQGM